jgi:hypothetical protein
MKRKTVKISLTEDQINKIEPLFERLLEEPELGRAVLLGQVWNCGKLIVRYIPPTAAQEIQKIIKRYGLEEKKRNRG